VLLGVLTEFTNTQQVITEKRTGQIDGYNYELWKDTGNTKMTLLGGVEMVLENSVLQFSECQ
jgi:endo-1,4-beta-xylanase